MILVLTQPPQDPLDQDVEVRSPLQDLEDEAASQDQLSSQLKCSEVSSTVTQLRFERQQCVHKLSLNMCGERNHMETIPQAFVSLVSTKLNLLLLYLVKIEIHCFCVYS